MTSVLVRCEIAFIDEAEWNIMVFCAALNCLNYSSKVTFKFPANSTLRKQWLLKMKRIEFSRICAVHFTDDYFRENLAICRFLGSDFKPLRLHLKEDAVLRTIFFLLFGKEITGKNVFRSTKTPLSVRLLVC